MPNTDKKQGYKFTEEFGYIPEDWEIIPLKDTLSNLDKHSLVGGPFGSDLKASDYVSSGVPVVQLQNIGDGNFIKNSLNYVTYEKANSLIASNIYCNEIILSKMGDPVARACIIPKHLKRCLMCSDGIRYIPNADFNNVFVLLVINSKNFRQQAENASTGSTRKRIALGDLKELKLIKPPLREQEKIAEVLSDVDELISSTQKLIDKKKDLKTATMQKLLTPKDDWKFKKFHEVANMNSGGTPASSNTLYYGGDIPFLSINDLTTQGKYLKKTEKYITELGLKNSSARIVTKENLLYAMYATIGKCSITKIDVAISQAVLGIIADEKYLNKEYLYYHLSYIENKVKSIGQTGTQSNLSKQIISKFDIPIPSLKEQQKIVQILSDMDSEIEALEQELAKYKDLKTGMMQQLLTGKTRLV